MKRFFLSLIAGTSLIINFSLNAQTKKLVTEINSLITKEIISFKYNNKNQLIYFDEKGLVIYREFSFKYDKTGRLSECYIEQDKGEYVQHSLFSYKDDGTIEEKIKNSGKRMQDKTTEYNNIHLDSKGQLAKTLFEDGKLWEEFEYDNDGNIITHTIYTIKGDKDIVNTYKRGEKMSDLMEKNAFPSWFWALHLHSMQWCICLQGKNNITEYITNSSLYGVDIVDVTYEFDAEGYPIKEYHDGELAKEFSYKVVK